MARPRYDITGTVITEHGIEVENPSIYVDTKVNDFSSKNQLHAEIEVYSTPSAKSERLAHFKLLVQKTRKVQSKNEQGELLFDENNNPVLEDQIYYQRVNNFTAFQLTPEEKSSYGAPTYTEFERKMIAHFLNIPLNNIALAWENVE